MHPEVMQFVRSTLELHSHNLQRQLTIVEAGALNVNGSPREAVSAWRTSPEMDRYVGVDLGPGPGVDIVSPFHLVDLPDESADLVLSTEMLEHDPHWESSLVRMCHLLKSGGYLILTWAVPPRPPHYEGNSKDHYRNVERDEVAERLLPYMKELYIGSETVTMTGLVWGRKL